MRAVSWEHLHVIAHSFPIVLTASGTLVGLYGWARNQEPLELWGLVALVIAGAFIAPAYLTGLAAADVVAERTFVSEGVVQTHRFWATWAAIPVFTVAALAAFALHERDRKLRRFVLLLGVFATLMIGIAAWHGSKIVDGPDAGASAATGAADSEGWASRASAAAGPLVRGVLEENDEAVEDERRREHGDGLQDAVSERHLREMAEHERHGEGADQQDPQNHRHFATAIRFGGMV